MSTQPVAVFDPQGVLRDVPSDQLPVAVKAGGMPAVKFMAPDKSVRFVPANRYQDAYKAGGTVLPFEEQEIKHPGFWAHLIDDARGMASSLYHAVADPDPLADPNVSDSVKNALVARQQSDAAARIADRKAKGYGSLYSEVSAPANEMLGVNVSGMEKSAAEGDAAGVMGHAAAVPAVMAASSLAGSRFSARLARAVELPPETLTEAKSAPLDATGENKPFAGGMDEYVAPKRRTLAELDATGENKPFAGGTDEPKTAQPRTLADLTPERQAAVLSRVPKSGLTLKALSADPATALASETAVASQPTAQPTPQPGAAGSLVNAVAKGSGDPLLDRLRKISAEAQAKDTAEAAAPAKTKTPDRSKTKSPVVPVSDEDLMNLLQASLKNMPQQRGATQ